MRGNMQKSRHSLAVRALAILLSIMMLSSIFVLLLIALRAG